MKKILITGGPTNEAIDEVMKITNMSTGSLSKKLCKLFHEAGYSVSFVANTLVSLGHMPKDDRMKITVVESTEDMLDAIYKESLDTNFDCVIHASAVGDYKADFSFLLEDLAQELYENKAKLNTREDFLKTLCNPNCRLDDSSKISSYQQNLTVKLTLTPKIIAKLREWFPKTYLCGCKLLENVPHEELIQVAEDLCKKNKMDLILANDLAKLREGDATRYPVSTKGDEKQPLKTAKDIFEYVDKNIKREA